MQALTLPKMGVTQIVPPTWWCKITKIYLFEINIKNNLMYFIWCLNVFMVVLLGKFTISPPSFPSTTTKVF